MRLCTAWELGPWSRGVDGVAEGAKHGTALEGDCYTEEVGAEESFGTYSTLRLSMKGDEGKCRILNKQEGQKTSTETNGHSHYSCQGDSE